MLADEVSVVLLNHFFFNFEKLHRHTLKTLFNRERHINVQPFSFFFRGARGEKMVDEIYWFLPLFPCGVVVVVVVVLFLFFFFYPFQSPTCSPLKMA